MTKHENEASKTRKSTFKPPFKGLRFDCGGGSSVPVKNIVAFFGARCCTLSARIFHLLQLAFSATGGARLRSPLPPEPVVEEQNWGDFA